MAKRIRLGQRTELPLYALGGYVASGPVLWIGSALDLSSQLRGPVMIGAVIVFLVGAVIHILDQLCKIKEQIRRHDSAMITKINDSVGDVYNAGKRSKARHDALEAEADTPRLAVVHDLSPR